MCALGETVVFCQDPTCRATKGFFAPIVSQVLAEGLSHVFFAGSSVLGALGEQKRIHLEMEFHLQSTELCLHSHEAQQIRCTY